MSISGLKIILEDIHSVWKILIMIKKFKNKNSDCLKALIELLRTISSNLDLVSTTLGNKVKNRRKQVNKKDSKLTDSSFAARIHDINKKTSHARKSNALNKLDQDYRKEYDVIEAIIEQKLNIVSYYLKN